MLAAPVRSPGASTGPGGGDPASARDTADLPSLVGAETTTTARRTAPMADEPAGGPLKMPVTDGEKLRLLADWHDLQDDRHEEHGPLVERQVQADLRRIATRLDTLDDVNVPALLPDDSHTLVPNEVLTALGSHDQTGADHLADAVRLAEENDALRDEIARLRLPDDSTPATEPPPWGIEQPDVERYMPIERFVAGALSTLPPFDQHHPAWALPHARQAIDAFDQYEPDDASAATPELQEPAEQRFDFDLDAAARFMRFDDGPAAEIQEPAPVFYAAWSDGELQEPAEPDGGAS
jgi:hypothetical protein